MWGFVCFDSGGSYSSPQYLIASPIFMKLGILEAQVRRKLEIGIVCVVIGMKSNGAYKWVIM